jgi:hypothetical protein
MPGNYLTAWNNAVQQQKIAKHLLEVTFPLSKDPKLLLGVIYNLAGSVNYLLEALLLNEGILPPPELPARISKLKLSPKANILTPEEIKLIYLLQGIKESHQSSPVEFQRNKRWVICDKNYLMKILTIAEVKNCDLRVESLLQRLNSIIKRK